MPIDAPPQQRYLAAVDAALSHAPFADSFLPVFASHNFSLFSKLDESAYDMLYASLQEHYGEVATELSGIATAINSHPAGGPVTARYLAAWTWFHELAHSELMDPQLRARMRACTGIVAQSPNGAVVHARNMDQSPASVRNLTLHLQFTRLGGVVFEAVDWYWFAGGVMTAVRRGSAAMQENWRSGSVSSASVMNAAKAGTMPQLLLFASVLSSEHVPSFAEVLERISSTPLAAPMYAVVSGVNAGEGAIVVRNLTGAEEIVRLTNDSSTRLRPGRPGHGLRASVPGEAGRQLSGPVGSYFIAQTNYDPDQPDPPQDPRRTAVISALKAMGQSEGATDLGVYAAVSTYPVYNCDTAYSAVMRAADGTLKPFVRQLWPGC